MKRPIRKSQWAMGETGAGWSFAWGSVSRGGDKIEI